MKKILLFLTLFVTGISVSAKEVSTYYSDYGKWSEFSIESVSKTDLIEVEVERRYKWYKVLTESEYLLYDEGIQKYENVDLNNYQYTDYSEWNLEEPSEEKDRIIESEERYAVKKAKPIKKIYIMGGKFTKEKVNLNEIEIYNKNKLVEFDYICGGCSEKYTLENENGILIIDLDDYYYFDDLNIVIRPINNSDIKELSFLVTAPIENKDGEKIYYSFLYKNNNEDKIEFNVKDVSIVNPQYEEEKIYKTLPTLSYSDVVQKLNFYRYKDKLYYFYNNLTEYLNGYFKEYEGCIKDDNDYIDYFRYRSRDKLEISDYIEINKKDDQIDNYINSTVQYQLHGDIYYDKNGIYEINVETYFMSENIPVLVNIVNNEKDNNDLMDDYNQLKKDYEKILEDYNKLKDAKKEILDNYEKVKKENDTLNYEYEKLKNEKNNLFLNYQAISNKYNSLIDKNNSDYLEENKCKEELETIRLKNEDNEKKLKLTNQAYDYLKKSLLKIGENNFEWGFNWYLLLFFLLILIVILIINMLRKRKNKNKF